MEPLKIAVVGYGYWGKNLVRNFAEIGCLAAVCDSSPANLEACRAHYPECRYFTAYKEVLTDESLNAVVIAAPAESHGRMVKDALLAGKDVFVEKPLCLSAEEGRALVELARQKNRILMVGHLLWYHPAVLKLKELVDAGELGRLQYIYSTRLNIGKIRREENILWSFAPHDISVILGLLDEMPDKVQTQGGNYLHPRVADVTVSLLSFPSGVKSHVFVSWLHPFKAQTLVVVGDKKMAVFDDVEKEKKLLLFPHSIEWKNHVPVANKAEAQAVPLEAKEPLREECLHFLECVRSRRTPRTDGEEALRVLTVLQQCQQALEPKAAVFSSPDRGYFVHESAFIDEGVEIGSGTSIWHVSHILKGSRIGRQCKIGQNVVVGPNVAIGDKVKIQNNVSVYEGVTLEEGVFCGPSMVFTNVFNPRSEIPRMHELKKTLVKRGATLGANCTIVCGVTVGRYAFVGAGAVVTRDVPDHALMVGVPARQAGWMCRCGEKLKGAGKVFHCRACESEYKNIKNGLEETAGKAKTV
jgi:UDP-2-acetamido-3-amino-2,3-dideoxy-glucuronate N-acetyltransferase